MTVEIPLTKGYVAIVDDEDADLMQFKWGAQIVRVSDNELIYATRLDYSLGRKAKKTYLHRVILGRMLNRSLLQSEKVDHINLNGLNNLRENLRLVNHQQNSWNSGLRANNTSGYKGVSWSNRNRHWTAHITISGKNINLGYFDDPKDAHKAYCEATKKYFGEFAREK